MFAASAVTEFVPTHYFAAIDGFIVIFAKHSDMQIGDILADKRDFAEPRVVGEPYR